MTIPKSNGQKNPEGCFASFGGLFSILKNVFESFEKTEIKVYYQKK
jgi:hypothetical protein